MLFGQCDTIAEASAVGEPTIIDRTVIHDGQGHTHILRHLLSDAPPLCPVDPRPVLVE
ncbi:hypothetical protein ACFO0N_17410 [Halobium salinum]|uniref:Uncharacterized protein n=1 Tax=Halobium salinum TaxID=1364940 RepID=A0ABD5PFN9_9EURY|nr:hypothetical protein [Halobium salinum]